MAVELIGALAKSTGVRLPSDLVFNRPTVDVLSEYLANQVGGESQSTKQVPPTPPSPREIPPTRPQRPLWGGFRGLLNRAKTR
jgi:hypothetical protein